MPRIFGVVINVEPMSSNARVDFTLKDNRGTSLFTHPISNTLHGTETCISLPLDIGCNNFRAELDWTNGNTTNPCKIKSLILYGSN